MPRAAANTDQINTNNNTDRDNYILETAPARTTGIRTATAEDMQKINAISNTQLSAEDVYVFECVISNNALDSYLTKMADSSLRNYMNDAKSGAPLLVAHNQQTLPIGRSFDANMQLIDNLASVVVQSYMLRNYEVDGYNTDQIARGIQAGVNQGISVGFGGSDCWYRCSICGNDYRNYNECQHIAGREYDGQICYSYVEEARLNEYSIVYKGACPGAVIRKAQQAIDAGQLEIADIRFLEDTYNVRFDNPKNINFIPKQSGESRKDNTMTARELLAKVRSCLTADMARLIGLKLDDVRATLPESTTVEDAVARVMEIIDGSRAEIAEQVLQPFRDAGVSTVDDLNKLTERAKQGDQYRSDLIAETLTEGIRAHGEHFDKERYERIFANSSIDDIKAFRTEFSGKTSERLGSGGRQIPATNPNQTPVGTTRTDEENLAAFRAIVNPKTTK